MADVDLERREGTNDFGKIYEQRISALIGVKCTLNENIDDMWMATNVKGLGAFDDLVLFVAYKENSAKKKNEIYLIQMKHKQNGTIKLSSGKNDLLKYQESYFRIKDQFSNFTSPLQKFCQFEDIKFLIFTNTKIDTANINSFSYECENDIINTEKMLKISNSSTTTFDPNFLNQIFIYHSQINVMNVEHSIKAEIDKYFKNCNIQEDIIKCFSEWHLELIQNRGQLKKIHIQSIILEHILLQYIPVPKVTHFDKVDIWHEITEEFKYIFFPKENHLPKIWNVVQLKIENILTNENINISNWDEVILFDNVKRIKIRLPCEFLHIRKKIYTCTKKELYLYLWQMCQVPLILNLNTNSNSFENIRTALTKLDYLSKRSYIFVGQNTLNFPQCSVFSDILDCQEHLREKILNNIEISLQGKEPVTLNTLKLTDALLKTITPDVLMELLENKTKSEENESEFYVSRFIQKPMVKIDILNEQDAVFVILVDGADYNNSFKIFSPYGLSVPLHTYKCLKSDSVKNVTCNKIIINEVDGLKGYKHIETIVNKVKKCETATIHFFVYISESELEWLYSNKNINQIRPYILNSTLVLCDSQFSYHITFNIISDIAGEGKSTFLNFLANHCTPDTWVIKLNIRDVVSYIDEGDFSTVKKFLFDQNNQRICGCNNFSWELFHCLYEDFKALLIVDGIDEIELNKKTEVFFNTVKSLGIKTVLATRPTLKKFLEEKYDTLSFSLEPLTNTDRQLFIERVLKNYNICQETYVNDVLAKISLWDNIVGAPLLITLLESLLSINKNELTLDDLDVTDLFDIHINGQLHKVNSCNRSTHRTLSRAALSVFYSKSVLTELFNMNEYTEDIEEKLPIFIEAKVIEKSCANDIPIFAHRLLAEFLVAKYFASLADRPFPALHKFMKSLFYKELETVRLFFDKIILKDSPLLKIINNDGPEDLVLKKI